jgi:hypothetical protein
MATLRAILLCFFIAILSGCATVANYSKAVNSWQGSSQDQLFSVWGYPNRIQKLSSTHHLLHYHHVDHIELPGQTMGGDCITDTKRHTTTCTPLVITPPTHQRLVCNTWFDVNRRGIITNITFRGDGCVASESYIKRYGAR